MGYNVFLPRGKQLTFSSCVLATYDTIFLVISNRFVNFEFTATININSPDINNIP